MFDSTVKERKETWKYLLNRLEKYYTNTRELPVSILPEREAVLQELPNGFEKRVSIGEAIDSVLKGLEKYSVHTPHPRYYGMFNPRTSFPSIIADTISAYYNPQLAAWAHAPLAVEIEKLLINEIGQKFGYPSENIDGVFATGGQEAHITAVHCALNQRFQNYGMSGLRGLQNTPIIYCSESSHHTIIKTARVVGLGRQNVRHVKVDEHQQMDVEDLAIKIEKDIKSGHIPFFVFATMGTTGSGAIDPIVEISKICENHNIWLHADAAYGGAIALTEKYKTILSGIEMADSITFDAHKWLSVPMAASMFITKHEDVLGKSFGIKADYMPDEESETDKLSSYTHSIQWSRRFIGLKLYLPLLIYGWSGFNEIISHHIEICAYLRTRLIENHWQILNKTQLPIVCFHDEEIHEKTAFSKYVYDTFIKNGKAWLADYQFGGINVIRVCITNYDTNRSDIDKLIDDLDQIRNEFKNSVKKIH